MLEVTAQSARPLPRQPVVSGRELLPWAIFAGVILLVLVYLVGAEEGATSLLSGHYIHELVHDSRHLLAFPCH